MIASRTHAAPDGTYTTETVIMSPREAYGRKAVAALRDLHGRVVELMSDMDEMERAVAGQYGEEAEAVRGMIALVREAFDTP